PTPASSTLSLHDALPILALGGGLARGDGYVCPPQESPFLGRKLVDEEVLLDLHDIGRPYLFGEDCTHQRDETLMEVLPDLLLLQDRKSTRLNSSHVAISY